jgi:purine-binding chemotaxis protein CheW
VSDQVDGGSRGDDRRLGRAWLRFELARESRRGPAEAFLTLGDQFLAEGHFAEAREQYVRTLALKPRSVTAKSNLAVAWACEGQHGQALEAAEDALRLKPDHPIALGNLGNLLLLRGRFDEALECHGRSADQRPGHGLALGNLAVGLAAAGRLDEAVEALASSLEAEPDCREATENLALLKEILGDADGAGGLRDRAEGLVPGPPSLAVRIGEVSFAPEDAAETPAAFAEPAEEQIPAIAAADDFPPPAEPEAARVEPVVLRDPPPAATVPEPAPAEPPRKTGQSISQVRLGQALSLQGKLDEATACFRRAVKYDPKNVEAHHSLGEALEQLGAHAEAADCFERVRALAVDLAAETSEADVDPAPIPRGHEPLPSAEPTLGAGPDLPPFEMGADVASMLDFGGMFETAVEVIGPLDLAFDSDLDLSLDLGPIDIAGAGDLPDPAAMATAEDPDRAEPGPDFSEALHRAGEAEAAAPAPPEAGGAAEEEEVDEVRAAILRTFGSKALAALDDDDEEELAQFLMEEQAGAGNLGVPPAPPVAPSWSRDNLDEPARRFTFADRFQAPASPPIAADGISGPSLESLIAQVEAEIRAEAPARPAPAPAAPIGVKHVTFSLGRVDFMVRMDSVLEVQRPPRIASVPNVPGWVLGVANLRGDIISVIDLRTFFGMEPADGEQGGRVMVVRSADGELITGLLVDRVGGVTALSPQALEMPAPAGEDAIGPYVSGVVSQVGGRMLVALDLDEFLQSDEMRQFQPQ